MTSRPPHPLIMIHPSIQVTNAPHKAELSHELIAAAASYEVCRIHDLSYPPPSVLTVPIGR